MTTLPPADEMVLRAGDLEAVLWPSLGGRIAAFRTVGGPNLNGQDWLEPIPRDLPLAEALRSGGSYPMAPYCGRIEQGRFTFEGQEYALPPHPISAPHSLHGIAWDSAFMGESLSESAARMTLDHYGDAGWPWAFRLEQHIALTAEALSLTMRLTSTDPRRQAVGLGFHPFYARRGAARLRFNAQSWWKLGPTKVPAVPEPIPARMDFHAGQPVAEGFDDVFGGFDGRGEVCWPDGAVDVAASPNLDVAVLFSPPGRAFVCFEPITHAPNAHNREALPGLAVLERGEHLEVRMELRPVSGE